MISRIAAGVGLAVGPDEAPPPVQDARSAAAARQATHRRRCRHFIACLPAARAGHARPQGDVVSNRPTIDGPVTQTVPSGATANRSAHRRAEWARTVTHCEAFSSPAAQRLARLVGGDRGQPRPDAGRVADGAELAPGDRPGGLRRILGELLVAGDDVGDPDEIGVVGRDDAGEGDLVPGAGPFDDVEREQGRRDGGRCGADCPEPCHASKMRAAPVAIHEAFGQPPRRFFGWSPSPVRGPAPVPRYGA